MIQSLPQDIQSLISFHLATGRYGSEEDVLREALRSLIEEDEDVLAVREAIDDWRAGDEGVPLDEAFARIRREELGEE
jgi:putative addiction module CopG family antidote